MSHSFKWCRDKTKLKTFDKQVFHINRNGTKYWFLNGELHRVDGPAVEFADGDKAWYLHGNKYSESAYWKELRK